MWTSLRPVAKGPNLNYTRLAFLGPLDRVGSAFGDRLQPQAAEPAGKSNRRLSCFVLWPPGAVPARDLRAASCDRRAMARPALPGGPERGR